jgi:hypothetical protein
MDVNVASHTEYGCVHGEGRLRRIILAKSCTRGIEKAAEKLARVDLSYGVKVTFASLQGGGEFSRSALRDRIARSSGLERGRATVEPRDWHGCVIPSGPATQVAKPRTALTRGPPKKLPIKAIQTSNLRRIKT